MATIMIRHNASSGAPPLPARDPPTHLPNSQSASSVGGRRKSEDKPVIHIKYEDRRAIAPSSRSPRGQPESHVTQKSRSPRGQQESHVTPRNSSGLSRRRDIETNSFIDRHSAKAYSDPDSYKSTPSAGNQRQVDHVVYPEDENTPPPPPISTLERIVSRSSGEKPVVQKKSPSEQKTDPRQGPPTFLPPSRPPKSASQDNVPPRPPKGAQSPNEPTVPSRIPQTPSLQSPDRPPKGLTSQTVQAPPRGVPGGHVVTTAPARPPKLSKTLSEESQQGDNPSMQDLERRFCFHSVSEFPEPEPISIHNKRMPSLSRSFRKVDQQERMGYL